MAWRDYNEVNQIKGTIEGSERRKTQGEKNNKRGLRDTREELKMNTEN